MFFVESLLKWYAQNSRDLPWRETRDPYPVWLSEVILQQTRIAQGLPYFEKFISTFPTLIHLAEASEEEILATWQGLGYYSRARNLHETAKFIVNTLEGKFPNTYPEILKLKGVGSYTAAAIASICFDEPMPVVDGNVFRFISRFYGIYEDISLPKTKKFFENHLKEIIDPDNPGKFNQAMMECGALICKTTPMCQQCPVQRECFAKKKGCQLDLPIKNKKIVPKERAIHYALYLKNDCILMKKREEKDIWKGLYDFPFLVKNTDQEFSFHKKTIHKLTHQVLHLSFYYFEKCTFFERELKRNKNVYVFTLQEALNLPKPKPIENIVNKLVFKT